MNILSTFSPEIEIQSIDEAFLKFKGFELYSFYQYGLTIQKIVTQKTGIPLSVKFAPTRALAKVANKIGQKFLERTKSVYVVRF